MRVPTGQRLILNNVDWKTYSRLLNALDERPALRLTYDRGTLEIMTKSFGHEGWAFLLARIVTVLTEELGLPVAGGGTTTFRRRRRRRGLEPDQCFWIAHEPQVRGRMRLDPRVDPPPDLAIEVEVSRSALNRMAIYEALGVPEVWRFDGRALTFHVLNAQGQYEARTHSASFPSIAPADLLPFVQTWGQVEENALVRQFRAWVRQTHGPAAPPTP
ncbi:MAG TPA: Uma2 family endonuclease [Gemmataceae bacterium]|nr:Uma2 family endonuclease [Gemmataceae bacterium]